MTGQESQDRAERTRIMDHFRIPLSKLARFAGISTTAGLALAACGGSSSSSASSEHLNTTDNAAHVSHFRPPSNKTFPERSDNHLGVAVFSSPEGAPTPSNVPARIPYGTRVQVGCVAPNESGMSSVNAFYLVEGGKWDGMFAVADSFANGGPMGPNPDNIDHRVPDCSS